MRTNILIRRRMSLLLRALSVGCMGSALLCFYGCGGGGTVTSSPAPPAPAGPTLRQAADARNIIIGTAAAPDYLSETAYAATLSDEFRQLEPENSMKFGLIHPNNGTNADYNFAPADQLVAFAAANNMLVRGHCLLWHQQVPAWLTDGIAAGTYGPAQLQPILQDHIARVAGHYAGKVWAWDVVNEAFNDDGTVRSTLWYDAPGIGYAGQGTAYIEQAFRWAHAADPSARLFYNDYGAETVNVKSDAILAMFNDFKQRGVPIDGIGFQAHVGLAFGDAQTLASFSANMKRFNDAGAAIHITELDIALDSSDTASLAAQADLYKKITQICLQTPNCKVLQTWGFTDKYSWIPSYSNGKQGWALPFDSQYNKKPAYTAILQALQGH